MGKASRNIGSLHWLAMASVAAVAGVDPAEAKTIDQRPAMLQNLEWRPSRWVAGSTTSSIDPVEQIRFSFYDNQLFRVVVDYGHERTEGMTGADMIEGISSIYGPLRPRSSLVAGRAGSQLEAEWGWLVARWGDSEQRVALYQTSSYGATYRLTVADARLDSLAGMAEAQAGRLDDQEAPAREIARQTKERDDGRAAAAKARATKACFASSAPEPLETRRFVRCDKQTGNSAVHAMFKLIPRMKRGSATGIAEVWARYPTVAAARLGIATLLPTIGSYAP